MPEPMSLLETTHRRRTTTAETLVDLLRQRAARLGNATAYTFLHEDGSRQSLTYAELDAAAQTIAAKLQQSLLPGDRALLVYPAGLDFIAAFFGCLYAGVVAAPATYPKPRRPLPRMRKIAEDSGATVALTTSQTLDTIDFQQQDSQVRSLQWIATDRLPRSSNWRPVDIEPDDLAFLQYTSGSTSDPKGVMVSHGNLLANLEAIRVAFGIEPGREESPVGCFWLPAYHDMGLIGGVLTPLYVGGMSVLMSPASFLQKPLRWLQAIDEFGAVISGAPNFAYEYCVRRTTPAERASLDLSRWRLAFCGAEPIRAETLQDFADAFEPVGYSARAFYPCYGLAETTLLAAGPDHRENPRILAVDRRALADNIVVPADDLPADQTQELIGCGSAPIDHVLVIVDRATHAPLPEGQVGEILVQGPSVTRGYWRRDDETRRTFAAKVPGYPGRFVRTGDLGFVLDGQLYVTGRAKDVIILRGRNHYPQDIEQTCQSVDPEIMPGAAFTIEQGGEERLVVVHQISRSCPADDYARLVKEVRGTIVDRHELDVERIVFIRQATLPVTSSGKVQRRLCREKYLAGELKIVHEWQRPKPLECSASHVVAQPPQVAFHSGSTADVDRAAERIEAWLESWLVARLGVTPAEVYRDRPFAEFGVDSLTAVELSHELEQQFGVPLPPVVAWNYPSPATLSRYLAEQSSAPVAAVEAPAADALADEELQKLLAEVEQLSDEDAAKLLGG